MSLCKPFYFFFFGVNMKVDGVTQYKGYNCQQIRGFEDTFKKFFNLVKPDLVIEIGTGFGGFSKFLDDLSLHVISYDIHTYNRDIEVTNVIYQNVDIFSNLDTVKEYIKEHKKVVLMCDGGNKEQEIKTFAPLLKKGDFLMGHDYAYNLEYFNEYIRNKKWNWLELNGESVLSDLIDNNYECFMENEFADIMWLCAEKMK